MVLVKGMFLSVFWKPLGAVLFESTVLGKFLYKAWQVSILDNLVLNPYLLGPAEKHPESPKSTTMQKTSGTFFVL